MATSRNRGSRNPKALPEEVIENIKASLKTMRVKDIVEKFKVSRSTVQRIKRGEHYTL